MVCPYGRLQGVLLDPNSIVVAYDFKRGEPKGRLSKSEPRKDMGDCIDCNQCVAVCPTGIDIRNGTQLECINCTACIDACNAVMKKVRFPTGLIRYTSYNGILKGTKLKITPRIAGYTMVLVFLVVSTALLIMTRNSIEVTILRTPGVLYQETDEGKISNLYNIKIINKSSNPTTLQLKLKSPPGLIKMVGGDLIVAKNNLAQSAFLVELDKRTIRFVNTPIYIEVYLGEELLEQIKTSFIGPDIWRESQKK